MLINLQIRMYCTGVFSGETNVEYEHIIWREKKHAFVQPRIYFSLVSWALILLFAIHLKLRMVFSPVRFKHTLDRLPSKTIFTVQFNRKKSKCWRKKKPKNVFCTYCSVNFRGIIWNWLEIDRKRWNHVGWSMFIEIAMFEMKNR